MSIVRIKRLKHNLDLALPAYETCNSAGMDLRAAIDEDVVLKAGERKLIKTGFSIALDNGYEAQIRPRSGLALKNGLIVLNTPGTIDADYRGEVMIILANLGTEDFVVQRGMRIAQMVISTCIQVSFEEVDSLDDTERGSGGFGSTGV